MSYDIKLCDPVNGEALHAKFKHEMCGGKYAVGGTEELWLNVTYNYAKWYYRPGVFSEKGEDGIRKIYGISGAESIPILEKAIRALESIEEDISEEERKKCEDQGATGYWMPTRENAIRPLYSLLAMAKIRPDGVWRGD